MELSGVLLDLYGRIPPLVRDAVDGLDVEQLVQQPAPGANTIAWLAWHIARVQDHHVAEIIGTEQIWSTGTWAESFHLARDPSNTGYGHSVDDALTVRPETPGAVTSYLDAVAARTSEMLQRLSTEDLDRIIDRRWDPPVTLGVRLISIADDGLQHAGQAAYARGILRI
jgi:uncharacterized damage-inducible protein DinB